MTVLMKVFFIFVTLNGQPIIEFKTAKMVTKNECLSLQQQFGSRQAVDIGEDAKIMVRIHCE